MKAVKKACQIVATTAILLGTSTFALAVDIGGLDVPLGPTFSVGQIYLNFVDSVGDELAGYGKIDSINSRPVGDLCTDCELTYQFGGYTVTSLTPTNITFSNGWIKLYLGFGADKDFMTSDGGGSADDLAEATNGTLFLSLTGHAIDAAGNTFDGTGLNLNSIAAFGAGAGLTDVDTSGGGIANAFFDTNTIGATFGGPADVLFGASYTNLFVEYPSECPAGPACLHGSSHFTGSVTATDVPPVPEPATLLLLGSAFVTAGVLVRRKRS